jgi:exodeoxyribonuclease VII large subunit
MMSIEAPAARNVLTPSALNRLVRELLEDALPMVWIEGEISNFMRAGSGHWYFSLKDAGAEVRCAMFARSNAPLRFRPGNGSKVLARARVSLYETRGSYQLIVEAMEDAGEGALRRAFELLKAKLQAEGLFDASRKRNLPAFPRRLGVVTSARGAAIRDVLSVAQRRFALTAIEVLPVLVQGTEAPAQIAAMLRAASNSHRYDVILLTRGGGSLEDLAAFNDESVARAIVASAVPVVSAVGHEVDFSISDFVADLRAPTPSAAAELILPDGAALARTLSTSAMRLRQAWNRHAQNSQQRVDQLAARLQAQRPQQRLAAGRERMDGLQRRLAAAWARSDEHARQQLDGLARALNAVSPLGVLKRGYAILLDASGNVLRSAQSARPGEALRARLADGELPLRVDGPDAAR